MSDPRVEPLLAELAVEYESRYGDLFGRGAAAEELNRYPAGELAAPDGALVIVQKGGRSVAAHSGVTVPQPPNLSGSGPTQRTAAGVWHASCSENLRRWPRAAASCNGHHGTLSPAAADKTSAGSGAENAAVERLGSKS